MKILHWAIVLIAIILPISLICRSTVNSRFAALKDEVRINNAIDTATKDAIDQIIAVSGYSYDDEFGDVINITPALAQETVNTFFHTMAVNYNIPYKMSDAVTLSTESNLSENSYIQNYFASYIPAVVVLAYDGFYIYSQENDGSGYKYELSSKIPYTYDAGDYTIGYTLGDDVYVYVGDKCYSGRIKYNSFNALNDASGDYIDDSTGNLFDKDIMSVITDDILMILYSLKENDGIDFGTEIFPTSSETEFLKDYTKEDDGTYTVGPFHENRRKTIIKILSECLNEEINVEHNRFADIVGSTYEFYLPEISETDWINTINDITVMAFVQGIPVGTAEGVYFNSYALGGSQIVRRDDLYGNEVESVYSGNKVRLYHSADCKLFTDGYNGVSYSIDDCFPFPTEDEAIDKGFLPCQLCN